MLHIDNMTNQFNGGYITENRILSKILSIGFEIESDYLSKFTLMPFENEYGEPILMNTDTQTGDVSKLTDEYFEEHQDDVDMQFRQNEYFDIEVKKDPKTNDVFSTFLITNDIGNTGFIKNLNTICDNDKDKNSMYVFRPSGLSIPASIPRKQKTQKSRKKGSKTQRVSSKTPTYNTSKDYALNFVFSEDVECSVFSNVEWISTFYKIQPNSNIILKSLKQTINKLLDHLKNLNIIEGSLFYRELDNGGNTVEEKMITHSKSRLLFNRPGTNLYYMQTHYTQRPLELDDLPLAFQMTYSMNIIDTIDVIKYLTAASDNSSNVRETEISHIENCVNELFLNFNDMHKKSRILKMDLQNVFIKNCKNYLFLIFYKLFMYLNKYKQNLDKPAYYFKNSLPYNSRHSNYELYKALKTNLWNYYKLTKSNIKERKIVEIIMTLLDQPPTIEHWLLKGAKDADPNLHIFNSVSKTDESYGDPLSSFLSYFHFFENPVHNEEDEEDEDEDEGYEETPTHKTKHDWLEYAKIDIFSSRLPLNNNIILVEDRSFGFSLYSHFEDVFKKHNAEDELKTRGKQLTINNLKKYIKFTEKIEIKRHIK
jgi:hypothetical protein